MDRGAQWATVCRVAKSQTRLFSNTFFTFSKDMLIVQSFLKSYTKFLKSMK